MGSEFSYEDLGSFAVEKFDFELLGESAGWPQRAAHDEGSKGQAEWLRADCLGG